jgi:hypothetical protein
VGRYGDADLQEGNGERSSNDLIDCQEGSGETSDFQVGKENEKMRLSESIKNSEVISYQQEVMMEEDKRCILIIGGIIVFLPKIPVEFGAHVEGVEEGQPTVTVVREEKEQTLKFPRDEGRAAFRVDAHSMGE